ncbi:S41 family peptidase [Undibacterium sp. TJN25]|uniref:S41 family peptidase n=1 Tax=Undibacterium sp. TJN25 TaxID=3413056 RepID=UPI003BF01916
MLLKLLSGPALAAALISAGLSAPSIYAAEAAQNLLLRQPAVSRDHLAFVYAGDIWLTDRAGQHPVQLTTHPASEFSPQFSPDGKWLAFSASYDNNTDVYVVSVDGGQPRRLTWHPGQDIVRGWSADGKRILFSSSREVANNRSNQLYEISVDGGFEKKVMEAVAYEGSWSGDGKHLAYRPYRQAYVANAGWRQYRGGATPAILIIDPASNAVEKVPHENATDTNPIWVQDDVYFISDRNDDTANLFAYNRKTKTVRQVTSEKLWDVRNASAYGQTIVYEAGGALKELDTASGKIRDIQVSITAQAQQARPQWKDASRTITSAQLSPTGKRIVLTARGDVFTVPVKDGSTRNLTETSGVREKDALWSPDGKHIAYISDAGANTGGLQHSLVVRDQAALEKPQSHSLGKKAYYKLLGWSPDSKTIVYQDYHLNLYAIALDKGTVTAIDSSLRRQSFSISFSADSRWLAYTVAGENHFSQIRLHDFTTGKNAMLTDGLSHADNPVFAAKDYLYFTASVNSGPSQVGLDMSTQERPVRSGLFVAVLAADGKSPLLPKEADEGKKDDDKKDGKDGKDSANADGDKKDAAKKADGKDEAKDGKDADKKDKPVKPVRIDLQGLQQRIVALPVAERSYDSLAVASDGALFYLERRQPGSSIEPPDVDAKNDAELYRFSFEDRKATSLKKGISGYDISADGKKLMLQYGKGSLEVSDAKEKLDAKPVDLSQVRMLVNPREEWEQIFNETWWMEKEFFYDPNLHGLNWDAIYARYHPLVKSVQRREDLNDLLVEMIGELQVGHNRVGGGDVYSERPASVGLLGADFSLDKDRYRIKTLYTGDRWNPFLTAPLAAPGLGIKEGDYIMAVNGKPLDASKNIYALLENTVGKQVTLTVSSDAAGKGRNVVVQPIANESGLRQWQWVEKNREYVQKKSNGKVAYVYLPNTADDGFQYFNRMFFAQVDKQAVIIDERRNSGGQAANYITDVLSRPYLSSWKDRDGLIYDTPGGAIYGPKAMLIDQDAGSGGDFLPYAFKRLKLGALIGKRTWGGLIGISANPDLIDGGSLVVPLFRFFTPDGEWHVENEGVAPDIDVDLDPAEVNKGNDTQLDAAIANVLQKLQSYKEIQHKTAPAFPRQIGK